MKIRRLGGGTKVFRNVSRRRGKQRRTGIDCRMKQVRSGTRKCERQQRER